MKNQQMITRNLMMKQLLMQNDFSAIDGKVLVAVSSGMDSMALLYQLIAANKEVGICYINHLQRTAAINEQQYLKELAEKKQLPFFSYEIIDYDAKKGHRNKQQYFRNERYRLLLACAAENGFKHLATGHHADDQVESYLFRLVSGYERDNMGRIESKQWIGDILLHRPLLHWHKVNLQQYCEENDILFHEDESNQDDVYARNRLRNTVIPELVEVDAKAKENIQSFFHDYETLLSFQKKSIAHIFLSSESWHQEIKVVKRSELEKLLMNQPTFIQLLIVEVMLREYFEVTIDLPRHLLHEIVVKVCSPHSVGVSLSEDILLDEQYSFIYINHLKDAPNIAVEVISQKVGNLQLNVSNTREKCYQHQFAITDDYELSQLEIRSVETKDVIAIQSGTKRLKKLYKDEKILLPHRKNALVLAIKGTNDVLYDFATKKMSAELIKPGLEKNKYLSWETFTI